MRSLLMLLVWIPIACCLCLAEDYEITGNVGISTDSIKEVARGVSCSITDSVCVESICRAVAEHYWENGYLDAVVSCKREDSASGGVGIAVVEGPLRLLKEIRLGPDEPPESSALRDIFAGEMGKPFSAADIEAGISEMLRLYDGWGYPLAKIQPGIYASGKDGIGLELTIDAGPKAVLSDVVFTGISKTKPDILLLESGLEAGSVYDGRRLAEAGQRLRNLGVFERVAEPTLSLDSRDTTITVTFEVVEAKTSLFEGLVAYAPGAGGDRFVGSLDIEFRNLAGTLRALRTILNKPGRGRLSWSVYYREPRILAKPFALEASLTSDVIDTSYARHRFSTGLTFRGEPRLEIGLGVFFGTTRDRALEAAEGNFSERGLSFDFKYEGRDDRVNPRSGQYLHLTTEVSSLDFEEERSANRTLSRLTADAERLLGLSERLIGDVRARFDEAYTSQGLIPESHLIRFGGMRSLRGYTEDWFSANRMLLVSLEARRILSRHSRVYVFADAATLESANYVFGETDGLPYGYGFGFMGGTDSGLIRLEVAVGRDDTWADAKLHLRMVRRF
jgi:outer membrane protein assembly factor BamA